MVCLSGMYRLQRSTARMPALAGGRRQSLSSLWTITQRSMVAVVIAPNGIAFGAGLYQRAAFDGVITKLETDPDATPAAAGTEVGGHFIVVA